MRLGGSGPPQAATHWGVTQRSSTYQVNISEAQLNTTTVTATTCLAQTTSFDTYLSLLAECGVPGESTERHGAGLQRP